MAVYTAVPDDVLARFMADHGLGRLLSCKGIAEGVENTNYLVITEQGRFFLTLYEKRVDPADLPFFLGLMNHLARAGISCPVPVPDADGRVLAELMGRPAAIVTFLDGLAVHRPQPAHCRGIGAALARMHLAGRGFELRRPNALGPAGWAPLFARFADRADDIAPGLHSAIGGELTLLAREWPRELPEGVIHADLFPDNAFFLGDAVSGLIDFYFACNDTFAYDVAVCLNAWCFEPDFAFNVTKGRALLAGYQSVRPLDRAEQQALPVLARGAALRFLLTRAYDWLNTPADALVARKDPREYLRKLRFHQAVAGPQDYGLGDAR